MEVVSGILVALVLYGILWFFIQQYHSAKDTSRQQGFEDGRKQGFWEGVALEREFEIDNYSQSEKSHNTVLDTKPSWIRQMPDEMFESLETLKINEAIDKGLITSIGIDEEAFFSHNSNGIKAYYLIVNGFALRIPEALTEVSEDNPDILGSLKFMNFHSEENGLRVRFQVSG